MLQANNLIIFVKMMHIRIVSCSWQSLCDGSGAGENRFVLFVMSNRYAMGGEGDGGDRKGRRHVFSPPKIKMASIAMETISQGGPRLLILLYTYVRRALLAPPLYCWMMMVG
jgi:hypothetical protein